MAEHQQVLPFYLLIDVSWSMSGTKIDAANRILPEFVDALRRDPVISDKVKFSVVDFSGTACVVFPLGDPSDLEALPTLETRTDGTNYSGAFEKLRETISQDVEQLKADGFQVHRPAVFFVSDGEPNDDERKRAEAFEQLTQYDGEAGTGFAYFPNLIPFAIDEADPEMLKRFVHPRDKMRLFVQKEDSDPGRAIAGMAKVLLGSVMKSGKQGHFVLEEERVDGLEAVPAGAADDWI